MRQLAQADRIRQFMRALGTEADQQARIYFTGGATAVLLGWRAATIDIDLRIVPEHDRIFRAIPRLEGPLFFHHFDLYAQALSKVERGHTQDMEDVRQMIDRRLVDPAEARAYFARIEVQLYRYPAIDPPSFRAAVDLAFGSKSVEHEQ